MDLSSLRIKGKDRFKDFNQRFSCLKNRIPTTVLPAEELLVSYYTKGLLTQVAMWVKRDHKTTLQEEFLEAILVKKDMFCLKDNLDAQTDHPSTYRRRKENIPKLTPKKKYPYDMDTMKKLLQNISNDMVDLKRNNNYN